MSGCQTPIGRFWIPTSDYRYLLRPAVCPQQVADVRTAVGWDAALGFCQQTLGHMPRKTTNPERALNNLLERDRMFTDRLRSHAAQAGVPTIELDTSVSEDNLVKRMETQFGL